MFYLSNKIITEMGPYIISDPKNNVGNIIFYEKFYENKPYQVSVYYEKTSAKDLTNFKRFCERIKWVIEDNKFKSVFFLSYNSSATYVYDQIKKKFEFKEGPGIILYDNGRINFLRFKFVNQSMFKRENMKEGIDYIIVPGKIKVDYNLEKILCAIDNEGVNELLKKANKNFLSAEIYITEFRLNLMQRMKNNEKNIKSLYQLRT